MPFVPRPTYDWRLRTRTLALGDRTLLMAILNVTPDSFSDGGRYDRPEEALARALHLLDEGADILDLGGESTRPNATPVTSDEEQSRVLPVLEAILRARPEAILSIDTFHSATAKRAVEAGAEIINDVSGHTWDPAMSATCAAARCGAILMHSRGTPQSWHSLAPLEPEQILPLVVDGLTESVAAATQAGLPHNCIVLDPGFGFGKLWEANFRLLARLDQLRSLDLPILAGISRKGFLTRTLRHPSAEASLYTTLAANTAAVLAGAHVLRVHDVRACGEAAATADALLAAL